MGVLNTFCGNAILPFMFRMLIDPRNTLGVGIPTVYRVAQKSKPLPNDKKIVLKPLRLVLFVKLKYESSTIILFVGIRYSMRDLLSDLNNYA